MTSGDENGGGRKPPSDDRTLLDPLSNEELEALREARKRMQEKRAAGKSKAIKHQIVITPESQEAKPDAPRSKPVLPSFEGDVTLDQIRVPPRRAEPTVPAPEAAPERARPATSRPEAPDPRGASTPEPLMGVPDEPTAPGAPENPRAGATGFGENTLLWMQPVKAPGAGDSPAPSPQDTMFQSSPSAKKQRTLQTILGGLVVAFAVGVLVFLLSGSERGVVELSTQPPGAQLYVNGDLRPEKTPVKLTLPAGAYTLRVEKEGYEPGELRVDVNGELDASETIDLRPKSDPGLRTITVSVEPIAATVTVDDEAHPGVRTVHVPNLDPGAEHRIRVEAGGFIKTEQVIRPGELQNSYQFTLERDETE